MEARNYRYTRTICAIFFTTISYLAKAQNKAEPQVALTLEEAWKQADAANKALLGQRKQVEVSQELVKNAQSGRLPRLPVRGEYAYLGALYGYEPRGGLRNPESVPVPPSPHAYAVALNAEWDVYTGGRLKNEIATQKLNATLDEARLTLTQQDIHLRVAQAYLDVRRNLDYQALTQANVR